MPARARRGYVIRRTGGGPGSADVTAALSGATARHERESGSAARSIIVSRRDCDVSSPTAAAPPHLGGVTWDTCGDRARGRRAHCRSPASRRCRWCSCWCRACSLWASRRALRLAARSRVGAESETLVRRELERLARDGWRVRHAVDWPGRGDLDHVVRAPSGTGFVIETKTLRWTHAHLARTSDAARWLARRRRRYPRGVVPVLCVTRARHVQHVADDVLVVSLDRFVASLRACAVDGRRQRGELAAVR